jgi:1,4-alpha-glucan branching enzyme
MANLDKNMVVFKVNAPNAHEVAVAGTFNDWDPSIRPIVRASEGNWKLVYFLSPGEYEYRFVVDGIWMDDPNCSNRRRNQYGVENCIVEVGDA